MLDFGTKLGIDCIKFQPIFDADKYGGVYGIANLLDAIHIGDIFKFQVLFQNPTYFLQELRYGGVYGQLEIMEIKIFKNFFM